MQWVGLLDFGADGQLAAGLGILLIRIAAMRWWIGLPRDDAKAS
jgi:hypothetical protein